MSSLFACLALCLPCVHDGGGASIDRSQELESSARGQAQDWREDLTEALLILSKGYAYPRRELDNEQLRARYMERLQSVESRQGFFHLVEQLVEELHDHHAHLGSNDSSSYRLVPSGLCVWTEHQAGAFRVSQVREGAPSELAGLRAGGTILTVDGVPISEAVAERLAPFLDRESDLAKSWAARTLLAGRHSQEQVTLGVLDADGEKRDYVYRRGWSPGAEGLVTHRGQGEGLHSIRIENSLGNYDLVSEFDAALDRARDAKVLVLDLTSTPGGGNSVVARGLMGRFTAELMPYQRHEFDEAPLGIPRIWIEQVAPRGDAPFLGRLLILVNRWTGSMGEGLTLGLETLPNATVIGTPMAGLKGATTGFTLSHSGLRIFLPTERLYHVDGRPRESFVPQVLLSSDPGMTTSERFQQAIAGELK